MRSLDLSHVSFSPVYQVYPPARPWQGQEEGATYTNKRFAFQPSYLTACFEPQEPLSEEGRGNCAAVLGAARDPQ